MKIVSKMLQYVFTAFGVNIGLLFIYFTTVENPAEDYFVFLITATLSAVCSLFICGHIKRSDNNGE